MASTGFTLWLTGLPSAVKTTITQLIADELKRRGSKVQTLDEEILKANLKSRLNSTPDDEDADMRHIGLVYELALRNEAIILATVNSMSSTTLEALRHNLQPVIEVEIRESNQRASGKESGNAPGLDSIGEQLISPKPKIVVKAEVVPPEKSVAHILSKLEDLGLIDRPAPNDDSYDPEDETVIRRRLESLGYL